MNERIAEIKHLCYIEGSQDRYDMEKFAELIVKECADVVRTSLLPSQNKIPATVALDIAARNIELLFGVE